MVARKTLDQTPRLIDLLRIESRRGFVQNEYVGIVQNRLCQTDALAVAFQAARQTIERLPPARRFGTSDSAQSRRTHSGRNHGGARSPAKQKEAGTEQKDCRGPH